MNGAVNVGDHCGLIGFPSEASRGSTPLKAMRWRQWFTGTVCEGHRQWKAGAQSGALYFEFYRTARRFHDACDRPDGILNEGVDFQRRFLAGPVNIGLSSQPAEDVLFVFRKSRKIMPSLTCTLRL